MATKKVGIKIEIDEKGAITSFKQLGKEGEKATAKIDKGSKKASKALKRVSTSGDTARNSIVKFNSSMALTTIGLGTLVFGTIKLGKSVLETADTYKLLNSQLRLVVDSEEDLISVQNRLLEVANETRQSFESTVTLYARLDRATQQLGLTDQQVIDATLTLNKAIIVSGASAEESKNAIIQLSQGLASGALRGDELRSILEQLPRVAKLIADGMGVTVGALRELGAEGKITAEAVVNAVKGQGDVVNAEFQKVAKTTGQTYTVLKNNISKYITDLDLVEDFQSVFNKSLEATNSLVEEANKEETIRAIRQKEAIKRTKEEQKILLALAIDQRMFYEDEAEARRVQGDSEKEITLAIGTRLSQSKAMEKQREREFDQISKLAHIEGLRIAREDRIAKQQLQNLVNSKNEEQLLNLMVNAYNNATISAIELGNAQSTLIMQTDESRQKFADAEEFKRQIRLENMSLEMSDSEQRLALLQEETDQKMIQAQEYFDFGRGLEEELLKIKETQGKKAKKINDAENKAKINNAMDTADASIGLAQEIFGKNKLLSIAEIGMSTARGVMSALGSTPPNPVLAGIIGATGAVQAAKVSGIKLADGTEFVNGAGTNRSDSVPAMLSVGERVVPEAINSQLGGISNEELLGALNGSGSKETKVIVLNPAGLFSDEMIAQQLVNIQAVVDDNQLTAQG